MTKPIEKEDFFEGVLECPSCKAKQPTREFYNFRKGYFRTNELCRSCDNEWRRRPQVHVGYEGLPEPQRANFGEGGIRCEGCGGVFSPRMFIKYADQYNTSGLCNSCQREKWRTKRQDQVMAKPAIYLGRRITKKKRIQFYSRMESEIEEARIYRRERNQRYYANMTEEQKIKKRERYKRYYLKHKDAVDAKRAARFSKNSQLNKAMWAFFKSLPVYNKDLWQEFKRGFNSEELFHECAERYKLNGRLTESETKEFCTPVGVETIKALGALQGAGTGEADFLPIVAIP